MLRLAVLFVVAACFSSLYVQAGRGSLHETSHRARRNNVDYSQALNSKAASPSHYPADCQGVFEKGDVNDGRYMISITTDASRDLLVYCDMEIGVGGWTVFQSRVNGDADFYRNRTEYEYGFGYTASEFWMGLTDMYYILAQKNYRMRVDLMDFNGTTAYGEYDYFMIGSSLNNFSISYSVYRGNVGNSLQSCSAKFTTIDHDLDTNANENCALSHQGAWWYQGCGNSNLNGHYNTNQFDCVLTNNFWYSFRQYCPLKMTAMKFRPM